MTAHTTNSYWRQTAATSMYTALKSSITTDVLIIGGGITGVMCAYELADRGLKPVLIESDDLCSGTTGSTTGKITVQHGAIYHKILNKYGFRAARDYFSAQRYALEFVYTAVEAHRIDCQLTRNTAFLCAESDEQLQVLKNEYETARILGISAELTEHDSFPQGSFGTLGYHEQCVIHPVRFVNALTAAAVLKGARVFCSTKAVKLRDDRKDIVLCTNNVEVNAKHIIMATQYPFYDGSNLFFSRLYPKRDYGIAVEPLRNIPDGSYINIGKPVRSMRTHVENGHKILIVVGDDHPTGRGQRDMSQHFDNLIHYAEQTAGVKSVLATWSAQDYETPDDLPFIGSVSEGHNLYTATGFGKWGLTNGIASGMILADIITNGSSRYENLFTCKRPDILTSPVKALSGTVTPVIELIKSKLQQADFTAGIQQGEGRVMQFGGEKAGIYRDYNDEVSIIDITCSHMGTELKFNTAEKTWDCPAHGGRYDTNGRLLEGPPKNSMKVLFKGKFNDLFD